MWAFLLTQSSHTASRLHGRDQKQLPDGASERSWEKAASGPVAGGEHSGARQKGPAPTCLGPRLRGANRALVPHPPNGASEEEGPRLSTLTLGLNIYTHLFKQTY